MILEIQGQSKPDDRTQSKDIRGLTFLLVGVAAPIVLPILGGLLEAIVGGGYIQLRIVGVGIFLGALAAIPLQALAVSTSKRHTKAFRIAAISLLILSVLWFVVSALPAFFMYIGFE